MATKKTGRNIDIQRNTIERYLMSVKDFVRENKKMVRNVAIAILVVLSVVIAADFLYSHFSTRERDRLDAIMDTYRAGANDAVTVSRCRDDLRVLLNDAKTRYVKVMGTYILASILFDEKNYQESYDNYMVFVRKSSSDTLFVPIAVNKAAVCLEEMGKYDEAIALIAKYSEDKDFLIVMDQMMYNTGRFYALKGDQAKAKEFFNRVRTEYPQSPYAEKAKERLFLLTVPQ